MKEIKLTGKNALGRSVMVDDEDYEYLNQFKWHISSRSPYAMGRIDGGHCPKVQMHRVILGVKDPKQWVDHKDHNGLNNQKDNIRLATYSQNQANRNKITSRKGRETSSKYIGVRKAIVKGRLRWLSKCIGISKTRTGNFDTEVEAAMFYNEISKELHEDFANPNILTEEDTIIYNSILKTKEDHKGKNYCLLCKELLDDSMFYKNVRNTKRGVNSYCKKCEIKNK